MPLSFTRPDEMPGPRYTAPCRLYLTRDGRVVEDGDPDVHVLLVPAGGTLPLADAIRHGLLTPPGPDAAPVADAPVDAAVAEPEPLPAPTPEPAAAAPVADPGTPPGA